MKILDKVSYRSVIDLFSNNIPNAPMLFSVLYGRNPGTVLVDEVKYPQQCVVRDNQGWTFRTLQTSLGFLKASVEYLLEEYDTASVISMSDSDVAARLPLPARVIQRLAFSGRDTAVQLDRFTHLSNSDRLQIVEMDQSILDRCRWKSKIEQACGDIDNFLRNGSGFCLVDKDGQIVTEAYAPFWGVTRVEIGIFTAEIYRGKGFATLASAYLISEIERQGYQAYWSCNLDNAGSVALAKKLGFSEPRHYFLLEYCA